MGCVFVLCVHAWPIYTFWGWCWLEMFFVLSGFLITGILLRTDLSQPVGLRNFLVRRVLRIWPVYYVALILSVGLALRHSGSIHWFTWLKSTFYIQFTEGYFTHDPYFWAYYTAWFRHSWSLAVEEQFYILLPLVMLLVKGQRAKLLVFCCGMLAVSIGMRAAGYEVILLLTRADGFALGGLMAILQQMASERGETFRNRLKVFYLLCVLVTSSAIIPYIWGGYFGGHIHNYSDIRTYGNWTIMVTAFSGFFFGVIGLMLNGLLNPVKTFFSLRPLTYLGEVSYAIYMFQGLAFELVRLSLKLAGDVPELAVHLLSIGVAILAGPASKILIERRFEKMKERFPVVGRRRSGAASEGQNS